MNRRHDLDALRVIAFGLLIVYHCGMYYVADWDWHLKSRHAAEWLQWPMLLSNRWRMALLFLISGLALSFLRPRQGLWTLAGSRTLRLLVPLLFGMFVIVPVQPYLEARSLGAIDFGFGEFLWRYWHFGPWPDITWTADKTLGITWNHLWYLAYLWVYSLLLIALLPLFETRAGRWLHARLTALRGGWLLLLPALPKTLYLATLAERYPPNNALFDDWYQHAFYFTWFVFGYALSRNDGLWAEIRRLRWHSLGLALLCYAVYAPLVLRTWPDDAGPAAEWAVQWLSGLNVWMWIAAVLGWSYQWLNRPFPWLAYANRAVYPWYLLHQSVIVALAWWLAGRNLGPVAEPVLLLAGTALGCGVLYHGLIRPLPLLHPLFGLKRPAPAPPPLAVARSAGVE